MMQTLCVYFCTVTIFRLVLTTLNVCFNVDLLLRLRLD